MGGVFTPVSATPLVWVRELGACLGTLNPHILENRPEDKSSHGQILRGRYRRRAIQTGRDNDANPLDVAQCFAPCLGGAYFSAVCFRLAFGSCRGYSLVLSCRVRLLVVVLSGRSGYLCLLFFFRCVRLSFLVFGAIWYFGMYNKRAAKTA